MTEMRLSAWAIVRPALSGMRITAGMAACAGGVLIVLGALLPWFTLFAGLQGFPGVTGMNGKLLVAGGAIAAMLGLAYAWVGGRHLRRILGGVGAALSAFSGWLMIGLLELVTQMQASPMMVARLGPGLFLCVGGALLLTAAALVTTEKTGVTG
ncbi:hypothetical protein BH23GEM8_BH23GEM8_05720 [soil metagenome]